MSKTSVSVIIPTYNSFFTIERALESVFKQTKQPKEIIIIDDKSTDDTVIKINHIIKEYIGEIKIKLILLDINSGPAKARNTGWNNSTSTYIAFLDSDDSWHPQKLEIQYKYMLNNPEIKLSGHLMELCINKTPEIHELKLNESLHDTIVTEKMLINKNLFTTTSNIMIKNDIKLRFSEEMRYAEDYYLWLQICFENKIALLNYNLGFAYKSYTGVSGLSGNVFAMYKGSIKVSTILLKENKISIIKYLMRISIRSMKFVLAFTKKYLKDKNEL